MACSVISPRTAAADSRNCAHRRTVAHDPRRRLCGNSRTGVANRRGWPQSRRQQEILCRARSDGQEGAQVAFACRKGGTALSLARRATAELTGTALLLAAVVGSGIMGERLAGGNVAIALLANTVATGAALVALILAFGPISGAHFNPAVTIADASQGGLKWREAPAYIGAQIAGAFAGVAAANVMFGEPLFFASHHVRHGAAQLFSEFVATFGLLTVIWGCARRRSDAVPFAVGAYITAAYWFTASTSFANPAVTLARSASDTFAGIRPSDVPGFVVMQLAGAMAATVLARWMVPTLPEVAARVVMPHSEAAAAPDAEPADSLPQSE